MNGVPFFGIAREHEMRMTRYQELIGRVLAHGQMLRGNETERLEAELAERLERKHVIAVNSGTDALYFALVGCNIGPGDKVLVTAFSFVASASSITRTGATPVFCDIDPTTMQASLTSIQEQYERHADSVRAILAVHLYGNVLNFDAISDFASTRELVLIEDAAQAFDAAYGDRPAGSLGEASALSFDPTKVVGAPGNGGAVLTDDEDIAERARSLRYHGRDPKNPKAFRNLGFNSQMPGIVAAVLLEKIRHSREWRARRQEIAAAYRFAIDGLDGANSLAAPSKFVEHAYHKFVLTLDSQVDREEVIDELDRHGIPSMVHYSLPLPEQDLFGGGQALGAWTTATWASKRVLSLPIHAHLTDDEVHRVVSGLQAVLAR